MEGCGRGGRTDQDRPFQTHHLFDAQTTAQVHDLPEQGVEQLAKTQVVLLRPLEQDALGAGVKTVEGFQRSALAVRHGVKHRPRCRRTGSHKVVAASLLPARDLSELNSESEPTESVVKPERFPVERLPEDIRIEVQRRLAK